MSDMIPSANISNRSERSGTTLNDASHILNLKYEDLLADRHSLQLLMKLPPIIRLQFRVFYTLLSPILVPSADVILRLLEED
jgi:hypothetical protein